MTVSWSVYTHTVRIRVNTPVSKPSFDSFILLRTLHHKPPTPIMRRNSPAKRRFPRLPTKRKRKQEQSKTNERLRCHVPRPTCSLFASFPIRSDKSCGSLRAQFTENKLGAEIRWRGIILRVRRTLLFGAVGGPYNPPQNSVGKHGQAEYPRRIDNARGRALPRQPSFLLLLLSSLPCWVMLKPISKGREKPGQTRGRI